MEKNKKNKRKKRGEYMLYKEDSSINIPTSTLHDKKKRKVRLLSYFIFYFNNIFLHIILSYLLCI